MCNLSKTFPRQIIWLGNSEATLPLATVLTCGGTKVVFVSFCKIDLLQIFVLQ